MKSVDKFHIHYEKNKLWNNTSWLGIPCWKLPFDAFVIQEIIVRTKPDMIIETGTGKGGSALFYASIFELMGVQGDVITVDIKDAFDLNALKYHWADRITFLKGDSTSDEIARQIFDMCFDRKCMVILDSWHTKDHVFKEMELYHHYVAEGSYMIIEDSHVNDNPVPWEWDDEGPMGAIEKWMKLYGEHWEVDKECEKHLMTFNPKGYLRRL